MSNSFYHERYCLTKAQREIIEPLLPAPKSTGRPALNSLTVFNAILWILSSGAAWRDLEQHLSQIPQMVRSSRFRENLASVGRKHGKISARRN